MKFFTDINRNNLFEDIHLNSLKSLLIQKQNSHVTNYIVQKIVHYSGHPRIT